MGTKQPNTPDITVARVREIGGWCQNVFRTHRQRGHSYLANFPITRHDMDATILSGAAEVQPGCIYSIVANQQSSAMFRHRDDYFLVDTHGGDIGGIWRCESPAAVRARLRNPAQVDVTRVTADDFAQFVQNPGQPQAVQIERRYIPHFPRNGNLANWEFEGQFQASIQRKADRGEDLSMMEEGFLTLPPTSDYGRALEHWKLWKAQA